MSTETGMSPGQTQSWILWCLALHLIKQPEAYVAGVLQKRSEHDRARVADRMAYIRKHRSIPLAEFLP